MWWTLLLFPLTWLVAPVGPGGPVSAGPGGPVSAPGAPGAAALGDGPFPGSFETALSAHAAERARVFPRPDLETPVIGVVEAGNGFPIHEILRDRPCPGGVFLRIATAHWVCSAHFRPSARFPVRGPVVTTGADGTPERKHRSRRPWRFRRTIPI